MIKNFRHACIVVRGLEKSLKFYRDILGLRVEKVISIEGKYPETVLGRNGVKFISAPVKSPYHNTKVCFAYGPDRHLIEFIEECRGV